jgi:hypothetical protein
MEYSTGLEIIKSATVDDFESSQFLYRWLAQIIEPAN